jgi:nitroreductase
VSNVTTDELVRQLQWRYAVKAFDPSKTISESTWTALEQSMVLAPSSFGLQPWRFIVITDPTLKSQLPSISWGQSQPKDCSHMVLFAARRSLDADYVDRFLESVIDVRGGEKEKLKGYRSVMLSSISSQSERLLEWNTYQVYIALGQLMTAAAMLGIDTCPMEGIEKDAYDKLLGLDESDYTTIVGCAVGYRHPADKYASAKKVRFPSDQMVQRF